MDDIIVSAEDYTKHNYIIYNGKLKRISSSSAYLLDMLSKNEEELNTKKSSQGE